MSSHTSFKQRARELAVIAVMAVVAAWLAAGLTTSLDRDVHALYARAVAGPSRTQAVVLVALDAETQAAWGPTPWSAGPGEALAAALAAGAPRLVIWPEGQEALAGPGAGGEGDPGYVVREAATGAGEEQVQTSVGVDPLLGAVIVRAQNPEFPATALRALGLPGRSEPLPTRFVAHLPTLSAHRVATGEIPPATFHDRVVLVGRADAAAATVATPLGPMSPAQVEAHALLGALDGEVWSSLPAWPRRVATGLWALVMAALLRRRSAASSAMLAVAAAAAVLGLDFALFAGGLLRVGVGAALVMTVTAAIAGQLLGLGERLQARDRLAASATSMAGASTASGLHKVSGA